MRIRTKITVQFTVVVASLFILFSFVIYWFASDHRREEFNRRLINIGQMTVRFLFEVKSINAEQLHLLQSNNLNSLNSEEVLIFDQNDKPLYSRLNKNTFAQYKSHLKDIRESRQVYFSTMDKECVGFLYYTNQGAYIVIAAGYDEFGHKRMNNLKYLLFFGVLFGTLAILIAGWFFARKSLQPISRIIKEAQEISGKNLAERLTTNGNSIDELSLLSQTFNQMLDRIHQTMQIQKSFLSNASHELRTPLSIIRARLELALTNKNVNYVETLESLYQEIKELVDLSNGLLEMTHLDSGVQKEMMNPLRLDEVVYSSVSECKRKYPLQKIELTVRESEDDAELLISGFEQLLIRCFVNIIDNACKYSSGLPVTIEVTHSHNIATVIVRDSGIGIASENMEKIKKPFYRAPNTGDFPGHGIGLSLVDKILDVHNASMTVNSRLNQGTVVKVMFRL